MMNMIDFDTNEFYFFLFFSIKQNLHEFNRLNTLNQTIFPYRMRRDMNIGLWFHVEIVVRNANHQRQLDFHFW